MLGIVVMVVLAIITIALLGGQEDDWHDILNEDKDIFD